MYSVRVTAPDGTCHTHPLPSAQVGIGRDRSNAIVLEGMGVSAVHAMIELQAGVVVLKDRGSTNGTYLNGRRLDEPTRLAEGDRFYVGQFLLELVRLAPAPESAGVDAELLSSGPLLRGSGPHRRWRDTQARLQRYAEQWDAADRPARLLLRSSELRDAKRWLATPPPSSADDPGRLVQEFVAASGRVAKRRAVTTAVLACGGAVVLGGAVTTAVLLWPRDQPPPATGTSEPVADAATVASEDTGEAEVEPPPDEPEPDRPRRTAEAFEPVEHLVVPGETLADIARRYDVSVDDLVAWNLLNRDAKLQPTVCAVSDDSSPVDTRAGQRLQIREPHKRPLPQQCVRYEVEAGEGWPQLAARFDVDITRLRELNPGVTDPAEGQIIEVWIDPKPYKPREPRQAIASLDLPDTAQSIGTPNDGRLENGIQLPDNAAYTRKAPNIMWGAAYMIENLHEAIVTFRQDVDFDGVVIVADMSKKQGGHFDPHKSHQAGRDVDIWLPTLKGVYKKKYLGDGRRETERRAFWWEVDWYATWGLARALIKTGSVEAIFLDHRLQPYVYNAAKNMGATKEELDAWIQYPRPVGQPGGILTHSPDHLSHIHVRFKCAPYETQCKGHRGPPGD
ncbi:MAG: penicillin-insensitive murein endopeptidase [Nannocystaceae bacterium]|nr:penicillin-insensitive murein endopeptidase [Nannocystaceae bacterium]